MTPRFREQGLWAASLTERCDAKPLTQDIDVDLAIVGGGFTGCSAALEAARLGAKVALVEANDIGHGGSGRNVGLVNSGLWLPPETILEQMGDTQGRQLIDALAAGPDLVFDTIDREGISCEATRAGTLHLAHSPAGVADLENRHRQSNAFGASLHLLDADETRRRTGTDAFHGALLNPSAGTIQPLAYCHGLANAAQRAGAQIFARSKVRDIARERDIWTLRTDAGTIRSGALLVATNAYPQAAAIPTKPQFVTLHYVQFATEPLSATALAGILPGKEGAWDTALVMSSFRLDAAGRLIIGGMGDGVGPGAAFHAGWARRKLRALFPQIGSIPFEHHWSGKIAMTGDHVPKLVSLGPSAYSVFGYSGRGIAPGTVMGRALARVALKADPEAGLPLPVYERYSERFTAAKGVYYEAGATLTHATKERGLAWRA